MKSAKYIFIPSLLAFWITFTADAQITINSPVSGQVVTEGTSFILRYDDPQNVSAHAEIYKGTSLILTETSIYPATDNTIYTNGFTPGTDYRVRVFDYNDPANEDWSGYFTVEPCYTPLRPEKLADYTVDYTGEVNMAVGPVEHAVTYLWYKIRSDGTLASVGEGTAVSEYIMENTTYMVVAKSNCAESQPTYVYTDITFPEDKNLNWIKTTAYGEGGETDIISQSQSFFDHSGKALQSQTRQTASGMIFASQAVKDRYGREALSPMAAGILPSEFKYQPHFIQNVQGKDYDYTNFDDEGGYKINNPDPLSSTPGTVGWYYSDRNTLHPYQATTSFPFTRTEFYNDGTGEVKRMAAPGDELRMGKNHEAKTATFPARQESNLYIQLKQLLLPESGENEDLLGQLVTKATIDANGQWNLSFSDKNQNVLISAIPGEDMTGLPITLEVGSNQYNYFYIPSDNITLNWSGNITFKLENLIEDNLDPALRTIDETVIYDLSDTDPSNDPPSTLQPGFYRMSYQESWNPFSIKLTYTIFLKDMAYNFYNDAGRLIYTMAPNGTDDIVKKIKQSSTYEPVLGDLTYLTRYEYNHQGWLLAMEEPDAGRTEYIYRKDGKIKFSQNAEQRKTGRYSFTNYDLQGRPIQSGEYQPASVDTDWQFGSAFMKSPAVLEATTRDGLMEEIKKKDINDTYYDFPNDDGDTDLNDDDFYALTNLSTSIYKQEFLRGAISYTQNKSIRTWYSYDEFGRVSWMIQKPLDQAPVFAIDYSYDYLGNVTSTSHQLFVSGLPVDAPFYHHYTYDADQRLEEVYTGATGNLQEAELQAKYSYYIDGSLKRVELGERMQGVDYTYTLQGSLKTINHPDINRDPGEDGTGNLFMKDAFALSLEYYENDYDRSGTGIYSLGGIPEVDNFYNGNIRAQIWGRGGSLPPSPAPTQLYLDDTRDPAVTEVVAREQITLGPGFTVTAGESFSASVDPDAMVENVDSETNYMNAYAYDDKYQLKDSKWGTHALDQNSGSGEFTPREEYAVNGLDYDPNGNIKFLKRKDDVTSRFLHDFKYNYDNSNNRLTSIDGYASYIYNDIGQLIEEGPLGPDGTGNVKQKEIKYDVTGKIVSIYENDTPVVMYGYDDRGFRLYKRLYKDNAHYRTDWYMRDAGGTLLAVYEQVNVGGVWNPVEYPVYGAGKLGVYFPGKQTAAYEVSDHLGNVRAIVREETLEVLGTLEAERETEEVSAFKNYENLILENNVIYDHTGEGYPGLVTSPSYSARLTGESNAVMGLTWAHTVSRGDLLSAEVYVKYNEIATDAASTGILDAFASAFTSAYGITSTGETAETYSYLMDEVFSAGPLFSGEADQALPKAYLNYLFFDKDFVFRPEHSWFQQVSSLALEDGSCSGPGFDPDKGCDHEKLSFDIIAPEDGSYYVYFSNESEKEWEVFFDDFKVTLDQKYVSETTDYYPFGLVMRQSRFNTEESYRFGYQGQFSEEDDETGWNSFELRMYDAITGRWNAVDPYRQYWSPYVGMGNDPINGIDSDGGFRSKIGAFLYSITHGGGFTINKHGENDFTLSKGTGNDFTVIAGREKAGGAGSIFDIFGGMLESEVGFMMIGSGADNISFQDASNPARVITIDLDEFLTAVNPVMQNLKATMIEYNNFNRTVSNPNKFDRGKKYADALLNVGDAIDNLKKVNEKHRQNNHRIMKPRYVTGPNGTILFDSVLNKSKFSDTLHRTSVDTQVFNITHYYDSLRK